MNKLKKTLAYDWIIYVLVVVISIFSWTMIFKIKHLPKKYESITIFYSGVVLDYSFEEEVKEKLDIKKVEIASSNPSDTTFTNKYSIVGLNNADVVLVEEEIASKTDCSLSFKELDNNYNRTYFTQENKHYGIRLSKEDKELLGKYFYFLDKDYVLMIAEGSVNSGELTTNSYKLVQWMVNYEV